MRYFGVALRGEHDEQRMLQLEYWRCKISRIMRREAHNHEILPLSSLLQFVQVRE